MGIVTYAQMDREVKRGIDSWTGSHSVKRKGAEFRLLPNEPGLPVKPSKLPQKYWNDIL